MDLLRLAMKFTMWKITSVRYISLLLLLGLVYIPGNAQRVGVDTDEIESVIDEWNFANNTRNVHSFEKVYADQLSFYTENVSRRRAITLKQQLFRLKPYFRQRITTHITYTPYSKGVVKCDFTKEVFEKTNWKKFPSYLLVSYEDNHYAIVGESDYATDNALKHKPDIGEPITFAGSSDITDSLEGDSSMNITSLDADVEAPEIADNLEAVDHESAKVPSQTVDASSKSNGLQSMIPDLSSLGMITVPKGYIFILVGMLGLGGLMIFIADSVQSRKRNVKERGTELRRHDEAEHAIRDFKMQSVFESFVITLFDPLYFRYRRPKVEHVYAGKVSEGESGPDLEFEFTQNETHVRFAIKCQYYRSAAKNEVQLFSGARQELFRTFEDEREMDLYYVLGFGGTPDDPKELFFLPAKAVTSEYITKAALRPYSKSGMFYFNRRTGSIQ